MSRTEVEVSATFLETAGAEKSAVSATSALLFLAAAKLLLHLATSGRYGFFRDELYYIDCGNHLAWGYVDQPPLIAAMARFSRALLGDSLFAYRFFPAMAGAGIVYLTGAIAKELGGKRFAQVLASATILLAPAFLAFDSLFSMNAFEPLFWMLVTYFLLCVLNGHDPQLWLLAGVFAGIGLENKHTMLVFLFSVLVGLLLTRERILLGNKWVWLGGMIALLIFLPNLIWEARHHWPQIETVRNAQEYKNFPISPGEFLLEQVLFLNPLALPVWLAGLSWLILGRDGRPFRCLGWAFVTLVAVFLVLKGKTYYALPAYPILVAAGGVAFERFVAVSSRRWLKFVYPAILVVGGIITSPFGVPVLPVETFQRYQEVLPLAKPVRTERDPISRLPQLYADEFGWPEMVATVARVYHSLPPEEQKQCALLAGNYGEAGAIDMFGGRYELPKAISGHNNYYLWGPRDYSGDVVIAWGVPYQVLEKVFEMITPAATISNPYAVPIENNLPVYICRKPKAPLHVLWPQLRYYI